MCMLAQALCSRRSGARVAQPPGAMSSAGESVGPANRGGIFFGYFLLAAQKKVTSRRAAPGEFSWFKNGQEQRSAVVPPPARIPLMDVQTYMLAIGKVARAAS